MNFDGAENAGSSSVDDDAGQDRDCLLVRDRVAQRELEHVADLALGLGAENIERVRRRVGVGVAHQRQQPHLGPVAMGDDQLVARPPGRAARRGAGRAGLVFGLERFTATQQGIAP